MLRDGNHSRARREPAVALSQILQQIADDESRDPISLADLMNVMQDRAIGALIFVLSASLRNALADPLFVIGLIFSAIHGLVGARVENTASSLIVVESPFR
jgi:hypothetical protein